MNTYFPIFLLSSLLMLSACNDSGSSSGGTGGASSENKADSSPKENDDDDFTPLRTFTFDPNADSCNISAPPENIDISPFYKKYCSLYGVPIVSSNSVDDAALKRAWSLASKMVGSNHNYLSTLTKAGIVIAIIGKNEKTTDIPEYSDLGDEWNNRARGLGATDERPAVSGAEENILCLARDPYIGENIFVHEFSHTLHQFSIEFEDREFSDRLENLYDIASKNLRSSTTLESAVDSSDNPVFDAGKYGKDAYALTNADEYWAEGVQSYYDVDRYYPRNHNELNAVDTELYKLIESKLQDRSTAKISLCP